MKSLKVLDMSRLLPGPLSGQLLTRLGATVVKVDSPSKQYGDYVRHLPPILNFKKNSADDIERYHGALFETLNSGKLGLGIDLKHNDAADIIYRLIPYYDVLIEGSRPGSMDKLKIGYHQLIKFNPRLIYCSISGYGSTGPYATRAGHDINYMALSGLLGLSKDDNLDLPPYQAADVTGALNAVVGILAAVVDRSLTGKGKLVDVSLTESAMLLGLSSLTNSLVNNPSEPGKGILDGGLVNYNIYSTLDGKKLSVGSLELHFWEKFCLSKEVNRPDLIKSKSYEDVQSLFKSKTSEEWMKIADKIDVCIEPVLSGAEIISHPQHLARNMVLFKENVLSSPPDGERTNLSSTHSQISMGPRLSSHEENLSPDAQQQVGHERKVFLPPACRVGEHTKKLLLEANFTIEEIDHLLEKKIIF